MEKYRIKEEVYKSGYSKFYPQGFSEKQWRNLSYKAFGFNSNGLDWCESMDGAKIVMKSFQDALNHSNEKPIEEKIYEM